MAVTTTQTNKPLNPRGNDQSPKGYNRAELYSGKALDFDGTNDNVEVADNSSIDFTTAMSAFCYVRVDSTSLTGDYIFAKYDYGTNNRSWLILQDNKNFKIVISKNGQSGASNTKEYYAEAFQNNSEYYFIGFTFESNVLKLYVNGQEVTTTKSKDAEVNAIHSGSAKLSIGSSQLSGSGANFFNGKVANARAFNVALTAAQVADLYNNPEKVVPTGVDNTALKLFLPMQEGAGTTAYDGSGNGNHGTISGATYVHGIGAPVSQTAVIDWNKGTNRIGDHDWDASVVSNNSSISTSSHSAPNGVETAFIFDDGTLNTYHRSYKQASCSAGEVTASTFVKKKDVNVIVVGLGVDGGSTKDYALVNLETGTIVQTSGSPTATSIKSVGDGWYYVSVQETHASGNAIIYIYGQDPTDEDDIANTYTGANNQTYIWGASVKEGAINNVFIPTYGSVQTSEVLLPQGLTSGRDITGVNLFENVRKQGALNLDGNSWAEVHDNASLDITTGLSLECWVYRDGESGYFGFLGKWVNNGNRSYLIATEPSNVIGFYISQNGTALVQNSYTLSASGWHHLVGTEDGTNLKLYVDGVLVDTDASISGDIFTSDYNVEIGRYNNSTSNEYANQIAQPRIYNRALTAEEVARNYDAGKNIYTND